MALQHITDGERRGLILLILVLVAVTILLTWRDRSGSHGSAGQSESSYTSVTVTDSVVVSVLGTSVADTVSPRPERRRKGASRVRKESSRSLPVRSPRDERVD